MSFVNSVVLKTVHGSASSGGEQKAIAKASKANGGAHRLYHRSADFQVCCIAGFQTRRPQDFQRPADLEVGDTAHLLVFRGRQRLVIQEEQNENLSFKSNAE